MSLETPVYHLRYPAVGDPVDVAGDLERLADDADSMGQTVDAALRAILGNVDGITIGFDSLTPPSGGGIVTLVKSGLTTPGSSYIVLVTANTSVPGSTVLGCSAFQISGTGFTLALNRTTAVSTQLMWAHIGFH